MKKVISIILVIGLVLGTLSAFAACDVNNGGTEDIELEVQQFSSLSALKRKIKASQSSGGFFRGFLKSDTAEYVDSAIPEGAISTTNETPEYSTTNVQTEGVDEGDIVKTDGNYIYQLTSDGFRILSVDDGNINLVSKVDIDNYVPKAMYITDNRVIVIGGVYDNNPNFNLYNKNYFYCYWNYYTVSRTDIRVYDISNINAPSLDNQVTVDGWYSDSRLKDGKLVYVCEYDFYYDVEDDYLPDIYDSANGNRKLPLKNVYYYGDIDCYSYTILGSFDISGGTSNDIYGYLGIDGTMYVSSDNLYFATYKYDDISAYSNSESEYEGSAYNTILTKLSLDTLKHVARVKIDGTINDKYSMDEYEGNLRIATTVTERKLTIDSPDSATSSYNYDSITYSRVYVLNAKLEQIGLIDNIAEGESIYSCRFKGTTGSLVTFRAIDPYFNLDLSDPTNPTISTGLKEDGVSYYIHYLGDSGFTIGVGRDTEAISDTSAIAKGIKISMYDNNSGEAVNVATYTFGDYGSSMLDYEPKSLLYDERVGLFAFPASYYYYDEDSYTNTDYQGLMVFSFDVTNTEEPLVYRGMLDNKYRIQNNESYLDFYNACVTRGVRVGDYIYTISNDYVVSYTLSDLTETKVFTSKSAE